MPQETPTPESQTSQETPEDRGSEDEALRAFDALKAKQPEAETEAQEDDPNPEPDEDDGETEEDTDPTEELVEVEIAGKKLKVDPETAAEVEKALLRQSDYSRKMNEVAAKDKAFTQKTEAAEKLYEGAEKFAEALAQVNTIDAQLKQFEKIDWQAIRRDNPAEYAALAADFQSLRLSKSEAEQKARGLDGEIARAKEKLAAEKRDEMLKTLAKDLKGWGDELGTEITKYAISKGYSVQDIQQVTDPKWVIAMDKARKYDNLQEGKKALREKAKEAPPVAKPGAPRQPNTANDALARFRKTRSDEDAIAALSARSKR